MKRRFSTRDLLIIPYVKKLLLTAFSLYLLTAETTAQQVAIKAARDYTFMVFDSRGNIVASTVIPRSHKVFEIKY